MACVAVNVEVIAMLKDSFQSYGHFQNYGHHLIPCCLVKWGSTVCHYIPVFSLKCRNAEEHRTEISVINSNNNLGASLVITTRANTCFERG